MNNAEIFINPEKCLKDGICINICPCQIFTPGTAGIPAINQSLVKTCIKCGHCVSACPGNAITVKALNESEFKTSSSALPEFEVFSNLVMSRRSIRTFRDKPVELDLLCKLLDMTRYCPTAKNTQSLSWLIVNGKEKVRQVAASVIDAFKDIERMAPMVEAFARGEDPVCRNAPQLAIIYGPEKYQWGTMDAAIAVANLELAAKTSGIGTCWGGFVTSAAAVSKEVGRKLGLDDSEKIFAALMIGYPQYHYKKIPPRNPLRLKIV
ncbi:MAG: nitroreductase family protein [Candidatus Riflebacteria bacterium]|jgi:nitroreductase/NAD-dependent dihydropyrimidine dehydrogenase PreA subunit|nr:nitroreductase family protein [Candidatus Riflebacteria bacterium]